MATVDTTRPSLTIVKKFTYRGDNNEEWENTYFFDGSTPSTDTKWKALADAVIAEEKKVYGSGVAVVRANGHQPGDSLAVWSYDYANGSGAIPGIFTTTGLTPMPGDVAAWVRWSTTARTELGKPIFLRNYFHGVYDSGTTFGTTAEQLNGGQKTAMAAFGTAWVTGFSDGSETHHRCGPHGATGFGPIASTYLTTRSLKKRGKRVAA